MAAGEFNGDSDLDLAVANYYGDSVSILLGNGDGTFGGATNFGVGAFPYGIAVGNLNGDSDPDLAVANFSSDNVSILLGASGGGFSGAVNFAAGQAPQGVAVGDFNGGPRLDLAVANFGSGNVSILTGQVETALSTQATAAATAGQPIADEATLSGGSTPTGSITFSAYGPTDATCSGSPAFTGTTPVSGNGAYDSPNFTPTEAGTYRWIASYSGDSNNGSVATACGDAGASVSVAKLATTTTLGASPKPSLLGQAVAFTATVAGHAPTGTVTFKDGASTLGTAPLDADGRATLSISSLPAGAHSVTAVYGGDADNEGSTSAPLVAKVDSPPSPRPAINSPTAPTIGTRPTRRGALGTPSASVTRRPASPSTAASTSGRSSPAPRRRCTAT